AARPGRPRSGSRARGRSAAPSRPPPATCPAPPAAGSEAASSASIIVFGNWRPPGNPGSAGGTPALPGLPGLLYPRIIIFLTTREGQGMLSEVTVRRAAAADGETLLALVRALAEYERLAPPDAEACARLLRDGFGSQPRFEAYLVDVDGQPAGYAIVFET